MNPKKNILSLFKVLLLSVFLQLAMTQMIFAQEEEMQDALISLTFDEGGEINSITAHVTDTEGNPVEDLELYFFVKRTFSLLPFGDAFNMTDSEGTVSVDFPNDLPGDEQGRVTIVLKIMESDLYKDQSIQVQKYWGVPTQLDQSEEERSLSSTGSNAPWSLVIFTSSLILASWYIYWYIIYVLYKISKVSPSETENV